MVLIVFKASLVLVPIYIPDHPVDKMPIEDTDFCGLLSIPHSFSFPPSCLKLSLVDLMFEYFPTMEMLKAKPKLPNVLRSVRYKYTISMQQIIFPLTYILNSVVILLLYSFKISKFPFVLIRNFLELIIKQCQSMIKLKVQLFQPFINHTFLFLFLRFNFDFDFLFKMIFPVYNCGVYQLMVNYP